MGRCLIVANEAGGAEIISSWLRVDPPCDHSQMLFCLDGAAVSIFQRKLGVIEIVSLEVIDTLCVREDKVFVGTSWMPELERDAVRMAKDRNLYVGAFLDHWAHYRERFIPSNQWQEVPDNWRDYLPSEVFACDDYAVDLAIKEGLPENIITRINNPYMFEKKLEYEQKKLQLDVAGSKQVNVLYVSEPVVDNLEKTYGDRNYWGYTEYDLMNMLVSDLASEDVDGMNLRVRLHPKERAGKYDAIIGQDAPLEMSTASDIIDDLIWADVVVGVQSMALVVSVTIGLPSFSLLPSFSRKERMLPHAEICHCSSFAEVFRAARSAV